MSYFWEVDLGSTFQPFSVLRDQFGFVPNLFRAQTLLPRMIEAGIPLLSTILFHDQNLSRAQKECILLVLSAARTNPACFSLHYQALKLLGVPEQRLDRIAIDYQRVDLAPPNRALLKFTLKLGLSGAALTRDDFGDAYSQGLTSGALLDAVLTVALSRFLCTLSKGVGARPDFPVPAIPPSIQSDSVYSEHVTSPPLEPEFYLPAPELDPTAFLPFISLRDQLGSIPEVFLAQTARPDVLEAEVRALLSLLVQGEALPRTQKESLLFGSGPASEELEEFAAKLSDAGTEFSQSDIQLLRDHRFTEQQILEAVAAASLAGFLEVLRAGLGTGPGFEKRQPKKPHLSGSEPRHTDSTVPLDPDVDYVSRVQRGEMDAFEGLMNRHSQRVYRTLVGILGDPDEARDAMQDTFLKAFQHIAGFEQRSKFSTWLLSIASNTGLQRLRDRRPMESLDDGAQDEEGFRPRRIQAWTDDPEKICSQAEIRALVETGVMRLPAKYRVVVMLRDIEQLPIEETAVALGLGVSAIKARLLRGRLMLREALAPHFTSQRPKGSAKGAAN